LIFGGEVMEDKFKREIDYARISLTESCNLKCIYCMPNGYEQSDKEFISRDEVNIIVKALSNLGVKRIRLTGGEPLLRKDIVDIVSDINKIDKIKDIGITTNGVLLNKYLHPLKEAGLRRLNISLDSLKPETFKRITGGHIDKVLDSIKTCIDLGIKVKLNVVPIVGINDDEIIDFINLTKDYNIDVRFIELMPLGPGVAYKGVDSSKIKEMINPDAIIKVENNGGGPSEVFCVTGHKGRVGFISPMSHNFCNLCNRVRITSDGKLKTCLHNSEEIDLLPYINDMDKITEVLYNGIFNKYQRHTMDEDGVSKSSRLMVRIGG
jgi:GTP 3',8-cyclase